MHHPLCCNMCCGPRTFRTNQKHIFNDQQVLDSYFAFHFHVQFQLLHLSRFALSPHTTHNCRVESCFNGCGNFSCIKTWLSFWVYGRGRGECLNPFSTRFYSVVCSHSIIFNWNKEKKKESSILNNFTKHSIDEREEISLELRLDSSLSSNSLQLLSTPHIPADIPYIFTHSSSRQRSVNQ